MRMCWALDKRRFAEREEASARLLEILAAPRTFKAPTRVHGPCEFCKGWHLTSSRPSKRVSSPRRRGRRK